MYIYKYFEKKINLEFFLLNYKSLNEYLNINKNNIKNLNNFSKESLSFFVLKEYNNFLVLIQEFIEKIY